jgi:hypothetical protein
MYLTASYPSAGIFMAMKNDLIEIPAIDESLSF